MHSSTDQDNRALRIRLWHVPVAGLAATVLMTLMMYKAAPMMIGKPMDIAAHLSGMLGGSWVAGMAAHFFLGTIVFSATFALLAVYKIPGPMLVKGVVWGLLLWLAAMVAVMPLTGGLLFMGAVKPAIASLIGHILYGAVLGGLIGLLNPSRG